MSAPWTPEEIILLRTLAKTHTWDDVARLVGRSKWACESKASDLGIVKDRGALARIRKLAQKKHTAKSSGYLKSLEPDPPRELERDRMRGVCYGKPVASQGRHVNGNRLARAVAWAT